MDFDTYRGLDAIALAERVAAGEATASELLETAIARAEAVNPRINAIIHPLYERARARAGGRPSGPLSGVPFLVKDLFQDLAGEPAHYGCRALRDADARAPEDQAYVQRIEAAGAVIFGKTNTPEFGAKGITEPEAYGASRNPWNTDHTPGGSSGGSAAAVAAGIVPVAGANDGGGSIRIPAACCGLFGLKPGRGRTPIGPPLTEMMHGAAVNGVVSRSVRDSAAFLDALAGPEPGAGFHPKAPATPYLEACAQPPGRLTIGYSTRSPLGTPVHPEAVAAVEHAVAQLESLGHRVEAAEPEFSGPGLGPDFLLMWFGQMAASVAEVRAYTGCGEADFEIDTRAMAAFGRATSAGDYIACVNRWQEHARRLAAFHDSHDLYLTPTMAFPPARVGEIVTPAWQRAALKALLPLGAARPLLKTGLVEQMAKENLRWVPFTQLANLTGVPAMSVPLHWTEDGLPMGVMFNAPVNGEGLLLSLAAQLEQADPWFHRHAPLA